MKKELKLTESNHIDLNILGIKFHFLKPQVVKQRKKDADFYNSYELASNIPPASGKLRMIQLAETELMHIFDCFCKKHELSYWMDFGTLLGAVRHKGFIPWDDDIDIGMPRDDYEKMIELISNDNNSDLQLIFSNNFRNKCFVKIAHNNSDCLFLDIFPYDFYHSKTNNLEKKILSKKIAKAVTINIFRYFKTENSIRDFFKNYTKMHLLGNNLCNMEAQPSIFMGIDYPHKWRNKVYDYETIFPLKKMLFEKYEFFAPNSPDKVLVSIYGNYMKLPKDLYNRHLDKNTLSEKEIKFMEEFIQ